MEELQKCREEINRIDTELARLFEERMQMSKIIGEYKKERALPVKDEAREQAIIEKGVGRVADAELKPYYVDFQKSVMNISCAFQEQIIKGIRVGYSGVPGAYAYIAAKKLFPEGELISYSNFNDAYEAAQKGETDCAVLPLVNSYAGDVGAVMDLMFFGGLYVNQVLNLEIEHNLLGIEGASVEQVRTVVSHPQALQQCDSYIREHKFDGVEFSNTARAAQHIRDLKDPSIAAIASEETARLFGLQILEKRINTNHNNTTRFGVFSRASSIPSPQTGNDACSFILLFTVPHEAGSLAMTLDVIGSHGFNMRNLKSRPVKDLSWNYYFYVEAEGNISGEEGKALLQELKPLCGRLKLAGTFMNA